MQLREPVALGEDLQNAFRVLNEVRVAFGCRISGRIAGKDEQRQRLVFLTHDGDDRFARTLKTDPVDNDPTGKVRKGGKQAFDLVTMRADEPDTGVLGVFKTGGDQIKRILGHGIHHLRVRFHEHSAGGQSVGPASNSCFETKNSFALNY